MAKDEFHSQEELTVAAISYIPPIWLFFAIWHKWRSNYFTRYHMAHAFLLTLINIVILLGTGFISLGLSNSVNASFGGFGFAFLMMTGGLISLSLLITSGFIFYCAINAYKGRYIVLPGVTRLYYLMFGKTIVHKKESQRGQQRPSHDLKKIKRTQRRRG